MAIHHRLADYFLKSKQDNYHISDTILNHLTKAKMQEQICSFFRNDPRSLRIGHTKKSITLKVGHCVPCFSNNQRNTFIEYQDLGSGRDYFQDTLKTIHHPMKIYFLFFIFFRNSGVQFERIIETFLFIYVVPVTSPRRYIPPRSCPPKKRACCAPKI